MKTIRGATTIEVDTPEEIKSSVEELLKSIVLENQIKITDITAIILSSTGDIHSYYPAKAAREAGFSSPSLFSTLEPPINGALERCIRVMLFVENVQKTKDVYLRRAKSLRKDISEHYTIALDGPAGSGKSTVAKQLAKEYDILYLDTGAMYRACALCAIKNGVNYKDEEAVKRIIDKIDLDIRYVDGTQRTFLDSEDVSEEIRKNEVSLAASDTSKHPCVRIAMVEKQREIASKMSCVLDGRDIGSYVLPDSPFKFYVTASSDVRAKRRYDELTAKGYEVDLAKLKEEIELRDLQDSTREFAPLKKAEDAVYVDTSNMTIEEVVETIKRKIQEKI